MAVLFGVAAFSENQNNKPGSEVNRFSADDGLMF
jgi:hypothetical protein